MINHLQKYVEIIDFPCYAPQMLQKNAQKTFYPQGYERKKVFLQRNHKFKYLIVFHF